jgi:hypothetical protein
MKKILLSIAFIGLFITGYTQHVFPFDMQVAGDLTVDSVFMITTTPAVSTSDTALVYDNGIVKYSLTASDSSLWSIGSDITYSKNSGAVRITAGDLFPSVDGTYDLGTPTYGWDSLFLSSVIEYGSDLVFSYSGTKMKLTTGGKLGIGDNSPDSTISTTGGKFTTDILVGGGWQTWVPTLGWTGAGGAPTTPTKVARYHVVNNTVYFETMISGTNDTGNDLTLLNVTLPYTPKDVNMYPEAGCVYNDAADSSPTKALGAWIDCLDNTPGNRKLYTLGFVIANGASFNITFSGFYEITGK